MIYIIPLLLLVSVGFTKVYVESNYPLRGNNFHRFSSDEDLDVLLWALQRLKDVKDIRINSVGKDTIVFVERYPILKKVKVKGNWFVSDEEITSLILAREGEPLKDFEEEPARESLRYFYRMRGFLDADAEVKLKVDDEGYATIEVTVKEGDLYLLGDVIFKEARSFDKKTLLRESGLMVGDIFEESSVRDAVSKLEGFYRKRGFLEVMIYHEKTQKLKNFSPKISPLLPGAYSRTPFVALIKGLSNLISHPIAVSKAVLGKGSSAVPLYDINEGERYKLLFEGNAFFDDEELLSSLDLNTAGVDMFFLERSVKTIEDLYLKKGFFDVQVDYSYEDNRITFHIKEGERYKLRVLGFKAIRMPRFYDREEINRRIGDFLEAKRSEGYLSASIKRHQEVVREKKVVLLVLEFYPGKKVVLKDIVYKGKDEDIEGFFNKYRSLLPMTLKEEFLEQFNGDLEGFLKGEGYFDAEVSLEVVTEESEEEIALTYIYKVNKGRRYRYGKTIIYGNDHTKEVEIAYTMADAHYYSDTTEEENLWNLIQSEIFSGVRTERFIDKERKLVHRVVEVREDKRGLLELAVGYNSEEKVKLEGGVKIKNLLGMGMIARARASRSERFQTYEVGLSDKFFFSHKHFVDTALFRSLEFHNSYDLDSEGFSISAGYRPIRWLSMSLFFSNTLNRVLGTESGNYRIYKEGLSLVFDKRDDLVNPKNMIHTSLRLFRARGDRKYRGVETNNFFLREIMKGMSLDFKIAGGWVEKSAPIFDRFFLGGLKDMRGYSFESIGSPLGGTMFVFGRSEVMLEVASPLWIGFYAESGNVDRNSKELFKGMKYDVGSALGVSTPAGFIRLDLAKPLDSLEEPLSQFRVYLSMGYVY